MGRTILYAPAENGEPQLVIVEMTAAQQADTEGFCFMPAGEFTFPATDHATTYLIAAASSKDRIQVRGNGGEWQTIALGEPLIVPPEITVTFQVFCGDIVIAIQPMPTRAPHRTAAITSVSTAYTM